MTEQEKFEYDLAYGQSGEQDFANHILNKKPTWNVEFNIIKKQDERKRLTQEELEQLRGWDVKITNDNDKVYLFEVKIDRKSQYTGNVAIEYRCVKESKSNYFVYILDGDSKEMYSLPKKNMEFILSENVDGFNCWGGDGKRSYMKIVKKEKFIEYAKKL